MRKDDIFRIDRDEPDASTRPHRLLVGEVRAGRGD